MKIRFFVQLCFILLCLWVGFKFILFIQYFESNATSSYSIRPAGVDGFLPISSLMNFVYYLKTGTIHPYHPAGLFILGAICLISLIFGKSFCSWFCFIGTLSEKMADFAERKLKIKITLNKWIDVPFRGVKYFLLLFFSYYIFSLSTEGLQNFLDGEYNMIADIKMYYFFAHISSRALFIIFILTLLSFFIRNFWCRYLCPYGALLGLLGFLSPFKIKRERKSCINCNQCTLACPSHIKVSQKNLVISDECSSCLRCVLACPVKDTLHLQLIKTKIRVRPIPLALLIIIIFIGIAEIGILTSNWQNKVSKDEYMRAYIKKDLLNH